MFKILGKRLLSCIFIIFISAFIIELCSYVFNVYNELKVDEVIKPLVVTNHTYKDNKHILTVDYTNKSGETTQGYIYTNKEYTIGDTVDTVVRNDRPYVLLEYTKRKRARTTIERILDVGDSGYFLILLVIGLGIALMCKFGKKIIFEILCKKSMFNRISIITVAISTILFTTLLIIATNISGVHGLGLYGLALLQLIFIYILYITSWLVVGYIDYRKLVKKNG